MTTTASLTQEQRNELYAQYEQELQRPQPNWDHIELIWLTLGTQLTSGAALIELVSKNYPHLHGQRLPTWLVLSKNEDLHEDKIYLSTRERVAVKSLVSLVEPPQRKKTLPKHSQAILAVDSQFFVNHHFKNGIHVYPMEMFYEHVPAYLSLRQRAALERDPNYRHVVPLKIVTQNGKIIGYRRLEGGGEARLHGKMSITFGGHIDLEDIVTYGIQPDSQERSTIDFPATVQANSMRELGQELHYLDSSGQARRYVPADWQVLPANLFLHYDLREQLGAQWSVDKDVHSVHIGLVYQIAADEGLQFVSGEPDKIELQQPMSADELYNGGFDMEEWTRLLLRHLLKLD